MSVVRWKLYNPVTDTELDFPINPREGGRAKRTKTIQKSTSTQGNHVTFEGREQMPSAAFSGVILTEAHDKFLNDWYDLATKVRVTNHLGQVWWAYLTELDITPRNRTNNAWSATFTATYDLYEWVTQYPGIT